MAVSVTFNTDTLTEREAGAVAALLLAVHPDALDAAARHLGPSSSALTRVEAEALERGTPEQTPVALTHIVELRAAEAFGSDVPLDPAAAFAASPAPAGTPVSSNGPAATNGASPSNLDATGLPHDKRIHSDPPKMTDKGVWRKRRGLNQLIEHQVVAELRATYPEPPTAAERTAQEAVATGLVPMPPEAGSIAPAVAPPPPPPPLVVSDGAALVDPTPAPSPSEPPATQFAAAMTLATAAQQAGKITTAETLAIVEGFGLTAIRELLVPANTHLIAAFRAAIIAKTEAA